MNTIFGNFLERIIPNLKKATLKLNISGHDAEMSVEDFKSAIVPEPTYKVYTALLTQSGGNDPGDKAQGDILDLGVTYYISQNTDNADLTIFGAPNSNVGTYFVCTNAGTLPTIGSISLLWNAGAPVVTVLENTIGNIWFTYGAVGQYSANFNESFSVDKVYFQGSYICEDGTNFKVTSALLNTPNQILISTTRPIDESNYDDILNNTPIEIRVYN